MTLKTTAPVNEYSQRIQFSQFDFVFINGNHYSGNKQIVLLDPEKEASINKRIDQITDIHQWEQTLWFYIMPRLEQGIPAIIDTFNLKTLKL